MKTYRWTEAFSNLFMGVLVFVNGLLLFFLLESTGDAPPVQGTTIVPDERQAFLIYLSLYVLIGLLTGLIYGALCFLYAMKKRRNMLFRSHFFFFIFMLTFSITAFLVLGMIRADRALISLLLFSTALLISLGAGWLGLHFSARCPRLSTALIMTTGMLAFIFLFIISLYARSGPDKRGAKEKTLAHPPGGENPNVCLITVDTLRVDHLHCYGYEKIDTRHIDSIAEEGVLFSSAFCQIPVTRPSHVAMLTGQYPGVRSPMNNTTGIVDSSQLMISEILSERGYRTAAFVSALPLHSMFGLSQGFDVYDDRFSSPAVALMKMFRQQRRFILPALLGETYRPQDRHQRDAAETAALALAWLSDHHQSPFFLWIHFYDPHVPYEPPPPFDTLYRTARDKGKRPSVLRPADVDYWMAQYDGEITFTDRQVGKILTALKDYGILDKTLLILTSDHGESFDHGYYYQHAAKLYDSLIHIPLVMRYPPLIPGGVRNDALLESIDLCPTILDILGIQPPQDISGKTMMPLLENGEASRRTVFAGTDVEAPETHGEKKDRVRFPAPRINRPVWLDDGTGGSGLRSARTGEWKLILHRRRGVIELFNLENDPEETRNLAVQEKGTADTLLAELRRWLADLDQAGVPGKTIELDEDMKEGLEALGYLY